jgi:hypothetical protein
MPHGVGVGALISPLFATQFAQMKHWSLHFAVTLMLSLINAAAQAYVFKFKDQDGAYKSLFNISIIVSYIITRKSDAGWRNCS